MRMTETIGTPKQLVGVRPCALAVNPQTRYTQDLAGQREQNRKR